MNALSSSRILWASLSIQHYLPFSSNSSTFRAGALRRRINVIRLQFWRTFQVTVLQLCGNKKWHVSSPSCLRHFLKKGMQRQDSNPDSQASFHFAVSKLTLSSLNCKEASTHFSLRIHWRLSNLTLQGELKCFFLWPTA